MAELLEDFFDESILKRRTKTSGRRRESRRRKDRREASRRTEAPEEATPAVFFF